MWMQGRKGRERLAVELFVAGAVIVAVLVEDKEHAFGGVINRVTGVLQAKEVMKANQTFDYSLKCKPTQRMF